MLMRDSDNRDFRCFGHITEPFDLAYLHSMACRMPLSRCEFECFPGSSTAAGSADIASDRSGLSGWGQRVSIVPTLGNCLGFRRDDVSPVGILDLRDHRQLRLGDQGYGMSENNDPRG